VSELAMGSVGVVALQEARDALDLRCKKAGLVA
jgi:hypothetical protein